MKKLRFIPLMLALALAISSIPFVVFAEDSATDVVFDIPVCDNVSSLASYVYANKGTTEMLSADQAAAEGVTKGYSGSVLKVTQTVSGDGISFYLDLRQTLCKGIKLSDIKSITFKYWVPLGGVVTSIRVKTKAGGTWQYNQAPTAQGEWVELTMGNGIFVADENGEISPFAFAFRTSNGVGQTMYFDSVSVEFVDGVIPPTDGSGSEPDAPVNPEPVVDTEAPVINWGEGIEVIRAAEGSVPLFNITATDDVDGEISTVLTWSEGAFDEAGRLSKGEHTLTITATDRAGNSSERSVFVFVNSDRPTVGHVVQDS